MNGKESLIRAYLNSGETFIDVGAHTGYYSRVAAGIVGPEGSVIAVEPAEHCLQELYANLENFENCLVIAAAAAARGGSKELYCSSVDPSHNRLFDHSDSVAPVTIQCFPLDDLSLRNVSFMKIDGQGSDHAVIYGARHTIKRCKPLIITEWWPDGIRAYGSDPLIVLKFYERLGYDISSIGVSELPFRNGSCSLLLEPRL